MDPIQLGVYDSFRVLRNCVASSTGIASNLLLTDEMLSARQMVSLPPLLVAFRCCEMMQRAITWKCVTFADFCVG